MAPGARRILLVDDVPEHRAIYRAILEHRGYEVIDAADGETAMRLAESDRPDLILMDVGLPWMDGWEVTRRLRAIPRTSGIPVVALSAHVGSEGALRARESGCAGFVAKTGNPADVVQAVFDVIGAAA